MKKSLNIFRTFHASLAKYSQRYKHEHCGDNPAQTTFASVTRHKNSLIIIPNKATVRKLEVKIDQVEQDALSKTIVVLGVSIDSLLENNLQDVKYNMSGIKSAITSEIDSFMTQTFAENDITELQLLAAHINI